MAAAETANRWREFWRAAAGAGWESGMRLDTESAGNCSTPVKDSA